MHRRRTKLVVGLTAAVAAMVMLVPTAGAATSCAYTQTSTVFMPWLDLAQYTRFPGSAFESGASGWSWGGGAKIVTGDSNLALAAGSHAVQVPGSGTAKSPWVCVNVTTPSMRFFVRRVSGSGSLKVNGVLNGPNGKVSSLVTTVVAGTSWRPSPVVLFPPALMTLLNSTGYQAQFLFVADPDTTFRIDDVHLDPFKGH